MSKKNRRPIPILNGPLMDTHCHLDGIKNTAIDQVLEQARAVGVDRFITIAVEPDNLQRVVQISENHDDVFCTQGIHPHDAAAYNDSVETQIIEGLKAEKVLAVGEIGLDYFYEHSDRPTQRRVFEAQLQIAADHDLPVVIHTREADQDTRAILSNFSGKLSRFGVIHSFTSGIELGKFCLDEGFMLGFNGIITFNRAENVREVCAMAPLQQTLIETDSPYLTPVPYRGIENSPQYIPFVAEKIAEIHQVTVEAALHQTYQNAERLFFNQ